MFVFMDLVVSFPHYVYAFFNRDFTQYTIWNAKKNLFLQLTY
jgi:hypothetical protein